MVTVECNGDDERQLCLVFGQVWNDNVSINWETDSQLTTAKDYAVFILIHSVQSNVKWGEKQKVVTSAR